MVTTPLSSKYFRASVFAATCSIAYLSFCVCVCVCPCVRVSVCGGTWAAVCRSSARPVAMPDNQVDQLPGVAGGGSVRGSPCDCVLGSLWSLLPLVAACVWVSHVCLCVLGGWGWNRTGMR